MSNLPHPADASKVEVWASDTPVAAFGGPTTPMWMTKYSVVFTPPLKLSLNQGKNNDLLLAPRPTSQLVFSTQGGWNYPSAFVMSVTRLRVDRVFFNTHSLRPMSTVHRVCTLVRLMGVQSAIVEALDSTHPEWGRITKEIDSI